MPLRPLSTPHRTCMSTRLIPFHTATRGARARLWLFAFLALAAYAGQPTPSLTPQRALNHQDFDGWRSISASTLSRDGRWLAYAYLPLEGDGEVVVRDLATAKEQRLPIGALPPPPITAADHNPERPAPRKDATVVFSSDSRFLIATRFPTQEERRAARRQPGATTANEGVVTLDLTTGTVQVDSDIRSFQVPSHGGPWLALHKTGAATGSELRLRRLGLPPAEDRVFPQVSEYSLARDGRTLVYLMSTPTPAQNGVYAVQTDGVEPPLVLDTGSARYRRLVWDRAQSQLVFLADFGKTDAFPPAWQLFHWARGQKAARPAVTPTTPGLPHGATLSGDHSPVFVFTGEAIQVFTAPAIAPALNPAAPLDDEESVSADLWHWKDDFLQPMQRQRADQDRKRAYAALYRPADGTFTQIADPSMPTVVFNPDGSRAFGRDDRAYRRNLDFEGPFHDLHWVDTANATRRLLRLRLSDAAATQWSPDGRWIAFYDQRGWYAVDSRTARVVAMTDGLATRFDNELADHPKDPVSYGAAGWTSDASSFLVYDRFDLWQLFPDGRAPRNVTHGLGRQEQTVLRVQTVSVREPLDARQGIDPQEDLVLRGESEATRASGFFVTRFDATTAPRRLLWQDKQVQYVGRAAEANTLLLTASRFDLFPDLHTTTTDFANLRQVSQGDDQRKPFLWGTAELRTYRNSDGVELPAALFKPAGFDPNRKYPLIVYLYERLSQTVNWFIPPAPATTVNPSFYTSNGYAVLMPDIAYRVGAPGPSALACVLPAVESIVREGWVAEDSIGLQGHSWGGYQTAYLITQTSRFRAAAAGAVVANMTSAYSGISHGSGRARQYKYESEQSRIGQPVYAQPLAYLNNSPVFFADRVTTPLLMLHNDGDDTVPFEQGVEFFLALRRAGKEVYLFNYHHEFHGLRRRADQRDYARRLHQFFDHHLKAAPRPEWMERGIPFLERETEKRRFTPSS